MEVDGNWYIGSWILIYSHQTSSCAGRTREYRMTTMNGAVNTEHPPLLRRNEFNRKFITFNGDNSCQKLIEWTCYSWSMAEVTKRKGAGSPPHLVF